MNESIVLDISRETIWAAVESSAPLLIISLIVGLIISIFQTVTSIQEQTITFVPKFLAIMLVLVLAGGWIMNNVVELFESLMQNIPQYIR
ncbi:MAG: flagellar biosynthesis protein FliQ [Lachnospiraceae bacterium]|nr:flagellar biosynthesis protein FliQ [Lachnospiraceae bacterium]